MAEAFAIRLIDALEADQPGFGFTAVMAPAFGRPSLTPRRCITIQRQSDEGPCILPVTEGHWAAWPLVVALVLSDLSGGG
jgi:hypothetical protein